MKFYLVGGAVRDKIIGKNNIQDKDWIVINSSIKEMIKLGFKQISNYPVFIHPKTNETYSMARKEYKISYGYHGFLFKFHNITLRDDLKRRDLTINAIAMDINNNIFDPYHGIIDIKKKVLRHITKNFSDDPVRILRLARFSAKFYNFRIKKSTIKMARKCLLQKEILYCSNNKIYKEFNKSLKTKKPGNFFLSLKKFKSIKYFFPELMSKNIKFSLLNKKFYVNKEIYIIFIIIYPIHEKYQKKFLNRFNFSSDIKNISFFFIKYQYFLKNIFFQNNINYYNEIKIIKNKLIFNLSKIFLDILYLYQEITKEKKQKIEKYFNIKK